ncbi:MAG: cytochrome P450 [Novosphingobium sp.]
MAASASLAPRPAHVPEALVYPFDMYFDPALVADMPARQLDLLRNAPPVFWTPHNGGHWVICSHDAISRAARDWDVFSSDHIGHNAELLASASNYDRSTAVNPVPIMLDPPEHTKYRAPLQTVFSPRAMMALKDKIADLTARLIEEVKPRGHCEFMAEIAEPIPVQVFLELFGLPLERQAEFRRIAKEHLSAEFGGHEDSQRKLREIVDVMQDTLIARRDNPKDDLISHLWSTRVDGQPLSLRDMENYCVLLFIAGLDTVVNGMGHGIRHLASDPALQAQLRSEPKLIVEAAEELLRRYTFLAVVRTVGKDTVWDGIEFRRGDRVEINYPTADVDAAEFPAPHKFDLNRENKAHFAFGAGPHRCLGSHLARIELQTLYEEMLKRLPLFRLDPAHPVTYRCGPVIGPREVHLVWDA